MKGGKVEVMGEGLIFYFVSWCVWVVVTFLMAKTRERFLAGLFLMVLIISSNESVAIFHFRFSLTAIIITCVCIAILINRKKVVYPTFASIIVSIGYAGMLLWETVVPVWVVMPRLILLSLLCYILLYFLVESMMVRLAIWGFGSVFGEFIYSMVVMGYNVSAPIGDAGYLDVLSLVSVIVMLNSAVATVARTFEQAVLNRVRRKAGFRS